MRSGCTEVALWPAYQGCGTPHNIGATGRISTPVTVPVFWCRLGSRCYFILSAVFRSPRTGTLSLITSQT